MAKKEQTAWAPCRPCGFRLPISGCPTSGDLASDFRQKGTNKLPTAFSFLVRCMQGIFHLKKEDISSSHWNRLPYQVFPITENSETCVR